MRDLRVPREKFAFVAPRTAFYESVNKEALIAAGLPTRFEALSIGLFSAQLAIIPLDESSRENAELLCKLWNDHHARKS